MMETPLIWTTRGNIPVSSLDHHVQWDIKPDQIVFIESYTLNGEIVKQSSHVRVLTGAESPGIAAI